MADTWKSLLLPLPRELDLHAPIAEDFREKRALLDQAIVELKQSGGEPSDNLAEDIKLCYAAPHRRLPLTPDEGERLNFWRAELAQSCDKTTYAAALLGFLLYGIFPDAGRIRPQWLPSWIASLLAPAIQRQAIISVMDDEIASVTIMNWVLDFARDVQACGERGDIPGGAEAWRKTWLPFFAFTVMSYDYYATACNYAPFVGFFGRLRAEAFRETQAEDVEPTWQIDGALPSRAENGERLRLGLFCSYPAEHGHGLPHFWAWLKHLDRARFEPVLIFQRKQDTKLALDRFLTRYPELSSIAPVVVVSPSQLSQIASLNLDVLYNMDDLCRGEPDRSGFLRLARRQITGFYTPATTGCAEVDGYISSPDLDPTPQDAFTEQVVMSQGLPFCCHYESYFSVVPSPLTRRDLDLPETAPLITFGSSMGNKMRPGFMRCLARILKRVPSALCVAMPSATLYERPHMAHALQRFCEEEGVDPSRIRLYPVSSRALLQGLVAFSDLFLDFFPFSGTNNIMDPLALGTPCVVLEPPCGYSRNRIGGAIMRAMGLEDCLAPDEQAYEDMAVALLQSPEKRQILKARLGPEAMKKSPLCDGFAYVTRMQAVIEQIAKEAAV